MLERGAFTVKTHYGEVIFNGYRFYSSLHPYCYLISLVILRNVAHLHATICSTFRVIDRGSQAPYNLRNQRLLLCNTTGFLISFGLKVILSTLQTCETIKWGKKVSSMQMEFSELLLLLFSPLSLCFFSPPTFFTLRPLSFSIVSLASGKWESFVCVNFP